MSDGNARAPLPRSPQRLANDPSCRVRTIMTLPSIGASR